MRPLAVPGKLRRAKISLLKIIISLTASGRGGRKGKISDPGGKDSP